MLYVNVTLPTFGSRSRMTPLACEVRLIMECAYFSASSSDIEGNLRSTWPCLLQITYPSTPPCTLIRSIVSSTSLCGYRFIHRQISVSSAEIFFCYSLLSLTVLTMMTVVTGKLQLYSDLHDDFIYFNETVPEVY